MNELATTVVDVNGSGPVDTTCHPSLTVRG